MAITVLCKFAQLGPPCYFRGPVEIGLIGFGYPVVLPSHRELPHALWREEACTPRRYTA